MKLLAFALVVLRCLQSSAAAEFQVEALYEMKQQLIDHTGVLNDWKDSRSLNDWKENQMSPCYWDHIICQDNNVVAIILNASGLTGVLSSSIAKLTTIQQLILGNNYITGGIPQEFGNLSSLTTLDLGRNNLNGSIPDSLGRLPKLQILDLSQNLLSGNIPSSFSNLTSLTNIDLSYNYLSGEIPQNLFQVVQHNFAGNHRICRQSCEVESTRTGTMSGRKSILRVIVTVVSLVTALVCFIVCFRWMRRHTKGKQSLMDGLKLNMQQDEELELGIEGSSSVFTVFNFPQVSKATENFSIKNKLGQGGFGPVYKGKFPDGLEIAVKRLASHSGQGFTEFKNEVLLIAKLQHRNLVRLLGCSSQGEEKMLVYEYLPNKSLDFFIFGIA